jgi:sterol desaturase/sphingolipid hydroxylase (fatty acid hydroxylase superfamily)
MPSLLTAASFNIVIFSAAFAQEALKSWIPTIAWITVKQAAALSFIHVGSKDKPSITNKVPPSLSRWKQVFYFWQSVLLETAALFYTPCLETDVLWDILSFIPVSFLFELVFDLFHYSMHRIMHLNSVLYKYHALHHSHASVRPFSAFQHHWIDLVLTNTIPLLLTSFIIPVSTFQLYAILWYKTIVEIGGHCGKQMNGSSFPQCIWLPRWLGIELYTTDHAAHHKCGDANYGKRFSLWDKVFGTRCL